MAIACNGGNVEIPDTKGPHFHCYGYCPSLRLFPRFSGVNNHSEREQIRADRFASGDEKLKRFTDAIRTADYRLTFPDDTPVKILRRGILSCSTTTANCTFVLMLPDDVRTVD